MKWEKIGKEYYLKGLKKDIRHYLEGFYAASETSDKRVHNNVNKLIMALDFNNKEYDENIVLRVKIKNDNIKKVSCK